MTAVTEDTFKLLNGIRLSKPSKTLHGPAKQSFNVLGQFTETLSHKENSSSQTIYVICGLKTNLLGLPAITSLQLVCRINEMTCDNHSIQARFPELFKGLGRTIQNQAQRRNSPIFTLYTKKRGHST